MIQPTSFDHGLKLLSNEITRTSNLDEDTSGDEILVAETGMNMDVGINHQASYVFIALGIVLTAIFLNL